MDSIEFGEVKLTEDFKKALMDIRDKSREIAAANNITQPMKAWLWCYGSWGDECIDPFYFEDFKIDGTIKDQLKEIAKPHQNTIYEFIKSTFDSTYEGWYQEDGGEGEFEFVLDDTIEVRGQLSLRESSRTTQFQHQESLEDEYWHNVREKLSVVFAMEIDYILAVDFAGSGDSGSCNGVYIYTDYEKAKGLPYLEQEEILNREIDDDTTVGSLMEDIGYRMMDNSSVDWYNNEGGGGEIKIDLSQKIVETQVWQNFQNLNEVWSDKISF